MPPRGHKLFEGCRWCKRSWDESCKPRRSTGLICIDCDRPKEKAHARLAAVESCRKLEKKYFTGQEEAAAEAAVTLEEYRRLLAMGGISKHLRGINIQRPWAQMILDGQKTVEARKYDLMGYRNEDLWIIETPGKLLFAFALRYFALALPLLYLRFAFAFCFSLFICSYVIALAPFVLLLLFVFIVLF